MSVATTISKIQHTLTTGSQALAVPFYFLDNTHIKAIRVATDTLPKADLVLGTDYTLTGAGNPSGGTLTTIATVGNGLTAGSKVVIKRNVPITQPTSYSPNDAFPAKVHEAALDRGIMLAQQIDEQADRAIRFPEDDSTVAELPTVADRASKALGFNSSGAFAMKTLVGAGGILETESVGEDPLQGAFRSRAQASVALMKAQSYANAKTGDRVELLGYYARGDGGGGLLYVDKADTTTADNGVTVFVATDGTRLKRPLMSKLDVRMAGVDGSGDTASMQAAINYAVASGVELEIPSGVTALCGRLTVSGSLKISGKGTLKLDRASYPYPANAEWILCSGDSTDKLDISGILIDFSMLRADTLTTAWNDAISPYANWKTQFGFTVVGYGSVNIDCANLLNFKRAFLFYQCVRVDVFNVNSAAYDPVGQGAFIVEQCGSFNATRISGAGRDMFNQPEIGEVSQAICLGFDTSNFNVTKANLKGWQIVARSADIDAIPNTLENALLEGCIIDTPPADTAFYGFNRVVFRGNIIKNSGDMGPTFDYSNTIICEGNEIYGTQIGGIYAADCERVIIANNIIHNVAQNYAPFSSFRSPTTATANGIDVKYITTQPKYVSITGNVLTFDVAPYANGRAITGLLTTNPTYRIAFNSVVTGNICTVNADLNPDWIVAIANQLLYASTSSGFVENELITGGTSGAKAELILTSSGTFYINTISGKFSTGETITGGASGATATVSAAPFNYWTGNIVKDNTDRFSYLGGTTV